MKRAGNFKDMTGKRFGKMLVVEFAGRQGPHALWKCRCDCGVEKKVAGTNLREGRIVSCGCYRKANRSNAVHGHGGKVTTQEYRCWQNIRARCYDPKNISWPYYGARGIKVCRRWRDSFLNFLTDMGRCPPSKSIDRIKSDGDYEPGNCKWSTASEQASNRRTARKLTLNERTQNAEAWSKELRLSVTQIRSRLSKGWDDERTLTQPLRIGSHAR